jgi:hypothetical protein
MIPHAVLNPLNPSLHLLLLCSLSPSFLPFSSPRPPLVLTASLCSALLLSSPPIQMANDYEADVYNGDLGTVVASDNIFKTLTVRRRERGLLRQTSLRVRRRERGLLRQTSLRVRRRGGLL